MTPPQGYTKAKSGEVCKLVKSLYGLKQALREWNVELCHQLFAQGFTQSSSDHCLFTRGSSSTFICVLVYVDDILITGPSQELIDELKDFLHSTFTIKDMGPAKFFLGIEIARNNEGTILN